MAFLPAAKCGVSSRIAGRGSSAGWRAHGAARARLDAGARWAHWERCAGATGACRRAGNVAAGGCSARDVRRKPATPQRTAPPERVGDSGLGGVKPDVVGRANALWVGVDSAGCRVLDSGARAARGTQGTCTGMRRGAHRASRQGALLQGRPGRGASRGRVRRPHAREGGVFSSWRRESCAAGWGARAGVPSLQQGVEERCAQGGGRAGPAAGARP